MTITAKTYTLGALIVFLILGIIDFVDTYALIRGSDGAIYESNPLAAFLLRNLGWVGLAIFKVSTILVVAAMVLIMRRTRPRIAAVLVTVACLTVFSSHFIAEIC